MVFAVTAVIEIVVVMVVVEIIVVEVKETVAVVKKHLLVERVVVVCDGVAAVGDAAAVAVGVVVAAAAAAAVTEVVQVMAKYLSKERIVGMTLNQPIVVATFESPIQPRCVSKTLLEVLPKNHSFHVQS